MLSITTNFEAGKIESYTVTIPNQDMQELIYALNFAHIMAEQEQAYWARAMAYRLWQQLEGLRDEV